MAVNRLASDMLRISEILGYSFNIIDLGNVGIETFKDGRGNENTLPMEVVYNREKDTDYSRVESSITKIFNAFMYGEQSKFWRTVILEGFETSTQIDFMLLVSFIYMKQADIENKETRIAESMSIIAAILCKYIVRED